MNAQTHIEAPDDARPMVLVKIPDGEGGYRNELRPAPAKKEKGKKAKVTPDPLEANPEASAQKLKQYIERLERLHEDRADIGKDIRDVETEAKSQGFDRAIINRIIKMRKIDPLARKEADAIYETYTAALGIAE